MLYCTCISIKIIRYEYSHVIQLENLRLCNTVNYNIILLYNLKLYNNWTLVFGSIKILDVSSFIVLCPLTNSLKFASLSN